MNIYVLVEGVSTELKVYPRWIEHIQPEMQRLDNAYEAVEDGNGYYVFSGEGYPSILNHIKSSVDEINDVGHYDFFVVVVDADEVTIEERSKEVDNYIIEASLQNVQHRIVVQNRCFETWILGNRRLVTRNPQCEILRSYVNYYDVTSNDPELMGCYTEGDNHAGFHLRYAKKSFQEKKAIYRKNNPGDVCESFFLETLANRVDETNHISSFKYFYDFMLSLQPE